MAKDRDIIFCLGQNTATFEMLERSAPKVGYPREEANVLLVVARGSLLYVLPNTQESICALELPNIKDRKNELLSIDAVKCRAMDLFDDNADVVVVAYEDQLLLTTKDHFIG